jgi:hypothetical protein
LGRVPSRAGSPDYWLAIGGLVSLHRETVAQVECEGAAVEGAHLEAESSSPVTSKDSHSLGEQMNTEALPMECGVAANQFYVASFAVGVKRGLDETGDAIPVKQESRASFGA